MTGYAYYPGCSLHGTSREFDESLRAVATALGVSLTEIPDWSCCGASSGHTTDHMLGVALPARNLAIAEEQGFDQVLAPCAACYNRLSAARLAIDTEAGYAERVPEAPTRSTASSSPRTTAACSCGPSRSAATTTPSSPPQWTT